MTASFDIVGFLTSDVARAALDEFSRDRFDPIRDVPLLRRRFERDEVAALADMLVARPLAQGKFGDLADRMVYTGTAVQQASPGAVARHRAARLVGDGIRVDLGCGIGADTMWLGPEVVGVDLDRSRLAMARHNARVAGVELVPVRADLRTLPAFRVEAAFADPGRRDENGRRIFDVDRYRPPLGVLLERWGPMSGRFAVKLHPGVDLASLPTDSEVEFISLDGDLKEACLWLGDTVRRPGTRATLLPSEASLVGRPLAVAPDVGEVRRWLFEPDGAVIRAGLVGDAAGALGLTAVDPTIAYLTGDHPVESPIVRGYRVEHVMPFNGKRIKAHLKATNVGVVTIKKRGSPVDPDRFRRSLDLSGDEACVLFLTRVAGTPTAIVCREP